MSKGKANEIDKLVGVRLRLRRTGLGISQEDLAQQLGVTFQQIQKYAKGLNRIGASFLFELSTILEVPVSYFFEQVEPSPHREIPDEMRALLMSTQGLSLWRAFDKLKSERLRKPIVALVKAMAAAATAHIGSVAYLDPVAQLALF